jgi:hypothetical protein
MFKQLSNVISKTGNSSLARKTQSTLCCSEAADANCLRAQYNATDGQCHQVFDQFALKRVKVIDDVDLAARALQNELGRRPEVANRSIGGFLAMNTVPWARRLPEDPFTMDTLVLDRCAAHRRKSVRVYSD